jgi:hypothetical protein
MRIFCALTAMAVSALTWPSIAHADADQYLRDLAGSGVTSTISPQSIVNGGYSVCNEISNGSSRIHQIQRLIALSAVGAQRGRETPVLTPDQASDIVYYAIQDLCPGADNAPLTPGN